MQHSSVALGSGLYCYHEHYHPHGPPHDGPHDDVRYPGDWEECDKSEDFCILISHDDGKIQFRGCWSTEYEEGRYNFTGCEVLLYHVFF